MSISVAPRRLVSALLLSLALLVGLFAPAMTAGPAEATAVSPASQVAAKKWSNRLYINLQSGREDLHRVNMAYQLARGQRALGRPVVIFFNINAPELATNKLPSALKYRTNPPLKAQLAELIKSGVKVMVCPTCGADQGITSADQLVPGAVFADPKMQRKYTKPGTVSMTY